MRSPPRWAGGRGPGSAFNPTVNRSKPVGLTVGGLRRVHARQARRVPGSVPCAHRLETPPESRRRQGLAAPRTARRRRRSDSRISISWCVKSGIDPRRSRPLNTAFPAVLCWRPRKNGAKASLGRTATMLPRRARRSKITSEAPASLPKSSSTRPTSSMFGEGLGASAASSSWNAARRRRRTFSRIAPSVPKSETNSTSFVASPRGVSAVRGVVSRPLQELEQPGDEGSDRDRVASSADAVSQPCRLDRR